MLKVLRGIKFLSNRYPGYVNLVAYHPEDSISWRWVVSCSFVNDGRKNWERGGYSEPTNGGKWMRTPWFTIALAWQERI